MRYKIFGKSGLRVSELCLGTMTFGEEWGWGADKKACRAIFDNFLDAGGNFIDTANRYTDGTSERFLGEFIKDSKNRDRVVLATKYTLFMEQGDPNSAGNHRKNMMQSVDHSLRRLQTDYIDLLWVHAWDRMTPPEEIMRGLDDLVRSGKVLYVGISDSPAWRVAQCNTLAELRGWSPFVGLQIEYSLIERTVERELMPMARAFDLAVTPWGTIAGGVLTGKYSKANPQKSETQRYSDDSDSERFSERSLALGDEVVKISKKMGCSPACVAINWARQQPGNIIPIIGVRTLAQLKDNLSALDCPLPSEHLEHLNALSAIEPGFPYKFLARDFAKDIIYAGTFDQIDPHRELL